METDSFWTLPRPPREGFDSVLSLWVRAGALFFEGFDFIFGVMLLVGVPASAVTLVAETAMQGWNSLLTIPLDIGLSSFFYAWLTGPIFYGVARRLSQGQWPRTLESLRWMAPRWLRLAGVLYVTSLAFTAGLLALVVPALYLLVKFSLADACALYEPERPAIQRSWELSRQSPVNIFLAIGPFLLASVLFTFGVDYDALLETPALAFAVDWSRLLLLAAYPTVVTALLYGWMKGEEDNDAVSRMDV